MERTTGIVQGNSVLAKNAAGLKPLRIGVIGLGVGAHHAAAYHKDPRCQVTVLCDRSPEKLREAARLYPGVVLTASAEEVLKNANIDVVSIASLDDMHYAMETTALEHGKHVFVEKPLCQTAAELQTLYQAWKRHQGKLRLTSNLVLRAAPLYLWLKTQIASGKFGELYAFDADYLYGRIEKITEGWRSRVENYSAMEGGGVHMMDLFLWLTGQRPASVKTWGNRITTQGTPFRYNDYMAATLECPSGLIARVTANFGCVHRHHHIVRVFGTQGTFIYDDAGPRVHWTRDPAKIAEAVKEAPLPAGKGDLITEFIDAIVNDQNINVETQSHFDVMSILIASDESLRDHKTQDIHYLL